MLNQIVSSLSDYSEKGIAVITSIEGSDPREVAEHVLLVLKGLKCSFNHYYNDVEDSYFIVDNQMEVDKV